jgi:hypothetical protein
MLSLRWKFGLLLAFLLAGSAWGQTAYNCLPTCDSTDARFLAIANGTSFITLSQPTLDLEIAVPKGTTTFTVGVFDGDARGTDSGGVAHWDSGSLATFSYTLYADPNRDHAAAIPVPLSGLPVQLSTTMPDNAWIDFTVNTNDSAKSPSGNYFYLLRIQLTTPAVTILNALKVRTSGANVGGSSLFPAPAPFSFIANLFGTADLRIVYPSFPAATPSRYDGTFDFYFDQPVSQRDVTVWDGDFDYGKFDGSTKDTDDPDTPNAPFLPSWATNDAKPEGVATGLNGATGNPPDDNNTAGNGIYTVKPPSIRYDLIFPNGQSFSNDNPSGNQEWEQFKISTDPFDRSQMDYHTDSAPAGIYRLHIQGLDMQNLNALLLPGRALCVDQAGSPCTPLRPYLLGDTVFLDENSNGVQDPGEPGIQGVEVDLYDGNDSFIAKTYTDADGHYSFGVEAYDYIVKIPSLNYGTAEQPGILFGFNPTTSETCQVTITNSNVLTCDFGYSKPASIGDRVWNDFNGNGVQDAGEPGLNNLVINLYDSGGNLVNSDTTHDDGNYGFSNLPAGTYTVRIDDTSLPGGLTPTYDLDGVNTPNEAAVTVTAGQNRTDVDFGYQGNAAIGDRVWLDRNGNGVQDPGEPGITGVTVQLYDDFGINLITSTVTGTDGHYSFSHLAEGTYTVKIDPSTLPADATETYDLDGTGTLNEVDFLSVEAGSTNNDVDFGYQTPNTATASVGDRVWNDVNGDGVQDANETGLNGVKVSLLDASSNVVATATTSGDGNYAFSNLAAGTYSVRIDTSTLPPGMAPTYDLDGVGTTNIATFDLATGQTRTDVDFGYQGTASVGDRVWLDTNGNGVQDAGEAGINGVTVQLLDGAGNVLATATTSGDGNYAFSHLDGGNYSVRVTPPAGVAPTYDLDGVATPNVAAFSLNAGDSRTDVDFGYRGTASVGDRVWNDANGNGTQDAGEAGINGATVQLLDAANNVVATATTSGDGNYTFSYLMAGTYSVRVTPPAGVAPTYDLDGVATPNVATFTLAAGQSRTDVDFGYRGTASVGDRVWLDANGNGTQDAGEAGINGVTVQLLDAANNVVATATTSGDGNYTFSNLSGGTYTVKIVASSLPAGIVETYDLDGVASANQASFTLAAGQSRDDVDFGYRYSGSVGDRVWNDGNGDGVQDAGEPGINGVTVQLLDAAGNVIGTTTTSGDGSYTFTGLPAGSYTVRIVASSLPTGFAETYDLDGVASANQASFALGAGQSRTDVDFGYRTPPPAMQDCATGAPGDPAYDQYPSGHAFYMPGIGTDFIFTPAPGTFVTLPDGTARLQGTLRSVSNPSNAFVVDVQLSGYSSTPPSGSPKKELLPNAYVENGGPIDPSTWYYYTGLSGTLTGIGNYAGAVININGLGAAFQVGVGANGKNTHFGASGWFNVNVVSQPASGNLSPTDRGDIDIDLGDCPPATASAGDRVWNDANGNGVQDAGEAGINGVTVQLLDVYGNVIATTTTSGDGNYTFGSLIAGTYTVRIDTASLPAGSAETYDLDGVASANQATFALATGQSRTDVDFGYRGTGSVGDRVWIDTNGNGVQDLGESGLNGVTIELLDATNNVVATATTSGDGNYTFGNLSGGTYTVRVSSLPPGSAETYDLDGVASANQATFTLAGGQSRTDVDFGYRYTGSVGDRIWLDANGNGVQDAGETGINGVSVQLLDAANNVIATTTTSGDGNYAFGGLAGGTYTVRVAASLPAGVAETYDLDGVASANQATFTLGAGQARDDVDFGYQYTGSVGDRVWLDTNGNGVQDAGEAGLNGVSVQLLDGANNVVATATTSGDGNYTFNHLAAGTYIVRVDASTLPAGLAESYDLDGVGTANQATFTLDAGANRTDVDFGYRGTASVGDRLWIDANGDGVQDPTESGLNGVTVELLDGSGNVVASTTTSGDGNYTFSNLTPGSYSVRVSAATLPAGLAPTYDLDGVATANIASFTLAAGDTKTDVDFGYQGTASVGDRLWIDSNGNGVQDAGETGLNGVTVELLDAGNHVVGTMSTTGDGNYTFSHLTAGHYSVRVDASSLPAGLSPTYDLDGIATANIASFDLTGGQSRTDVDFGYRGTGRVGDRLWLDTNGNGVQDAGEAGITGATVQLFDGGGNLIATTTTAADGIYHFDNLVGGTYTVKVVPTTLPAGVTPTFDLDGVATANQATFTLDGASRDDVDFGYRGTASVGDRIWLDANANGVQDAGENGINGVTVQLVDSANNVVATATTSGDGNYTFDHLLGGSYSVRVVTSSLPVGLAPTYDLDGIATANVASFLLDAGASRTDVDFGYRYTGSIGDRVWLDTNANGAQDAGEAGINGVTVELLNSANSVIATATTSGDGNYTFSNLAGGTYTVRVVTSSLPAGVAETYDLDGVASANQATFTLAAGANRTDVDFGYRHTGSIGDRVWLDTNANGLQDAGEAGINGVTVELLDGANNVVATDTTTGDGNYTFDNLDAGNYTVRIVTSSLPEGVAETYDLDGVASANQATFTLNAGQHRTDVDFGYRNTGSVGDRVWLDTNANGVQDAGETGINGVTVQLVNSANTVVATATTSGDGNYTFENLAAGTYTVKIVASSLPPGVAETYDLDGVASANQATFTLTPEQHRTDVDFGYRNTGSVGDRVWLDTNANGVQDAGEAGINGVTVQLLDGSNNVVATATTSGDGNYTFDNLAAGTYTVRIVASSLPAGVAETYDLDGVASANQATFTLAAGANRTDVDFGYRNAGSVGDRVWLDSNADGNQDAGEPGINGVTVQLLNAANSVVATATTSGDGNYTFSNLAAGTYTVKIVASSLPAGVAETYDLDGVASANQATFTLNAGASRTDVDFGYRATGSVGDRIWNDGNGNGVQDAGEAGINGVTVQLLDAANNVIATTTTSGNGNYIFANLPGGTYTVRVVASTLPAGMAETYDLDGVASADQATFALAAGAARTDVDFGYRVPPGNQQYCAIESFSDPALNNGPNGHAFWLPGIGTDFVFTPSPGSFTIKSDGTATLTGTLHSKSTPANGFTVTVTFNGYTTTAPAGSPKEELFASAYVQNGGSIDPSTWFYYTSYTGTLTGTGNYAGAVIQLTNTGPAFQIGKGANGKNGNFGGSGWYNWTVVSQPTSGGSLQTTGQGDINVDLVDCQNIGSVGDRVWNDANGNGVQDAGEDGINGVTVQLVDGGGNLIASTVTAGDGNYSFSYLAGSYSVSVVPGTLPAGVSPTYDLDGIATPNTAAVAITAGSSRNDVDFGYRGTASIGDRVWNDANGNGIQDAGEAGLNGITVQLLDASNNVVATATTAGDGNYTFGNLSPGNYTVKVVASSLPAGTTETFDLDGVATANTATLTLAAGTSRTDVDFGYKYTGSVGDRVWLDTNGNGVQDAGEAGINGATVQLLNAANTVVATTTTSGDGNYTFGNLAGGSYTVKVVASSLPAGTAPTYDLDGIATANQASFTLAAGASRTDVDFGYKYNGSIGDRVWLDANGNGVQDAGETGINGVTVQLLDAGNNVVATATTSGDGNYTFSNLAAGSYTVRIVASSLPAGVAPSFDLDGIATANQASFTLAAGANRTDVDFGYKYTGSIGDRVWLDTNGDGNQDAGEAGINGVTVQLLNAANTVVATTTTSGDGSYTFNNLAAGNYTVKIVASSLPAGTAETFDLDGVASANQASFALAAGQNRTDVDFGYRYTGSVGDRVWLDTNANGVQDSGEAGINGVTVQLLDASGTVVATTSTSGDGNYTFANLAGGNYTVKIVASSLPAGTAPTYDLDGIATANQAGFNLAAGASRTDVDFGYKNTGSIGDRVWLDTNGNGNQDAGEAGINGVTVQLLNSAGTVLATTTTSGDGNYTFSNLAPGTYTVKVVSSTLPAGSTPTFDLDGIATANTATLTLTAGQNRTEVDFGYRRVGSVGDRVWLDSNGNGIQDAGEVGLNGITVQLLDSTNTVIATAITSGDGNYTFPNLTPGSYSVRVPSLPPGLIPTYDLDGIVTPNFASFSVASGQNRTDVDFGYKVNGCAIAAQLDATYGPSTGGQAFWLPGIVTDLVFTPNPGGFVVNGDGTARLTGTLRSVSDPTKVFTVDVQFSGATSVTPSGSPKKELQSSAYKENGGPVDTSTWIYFTSYTGTLTGSGSYAGAVINIVRTGPAFQVGVGANGKNINFGGSGWYNWTVVSQPTSGSSLQTTGQGDINVDLDDCSTLGSVGDRVWLDANGNGAQDSGEAGINNVTVQLINSAGKAIASANTSGDGNYTFSGLPAGTYTVSIVTTTLPTGVGPTYDLDGIATANKATFTLAAAASRTDVDFGYRGNLSIGDRVWNDANGNGVQDSSETGYNGVTVQLLSGSTVIATTTTSGNGNYTFGNLTAGTYTVKVTPPAGTTETYDLDGLSSANQATVSLTASRTDVDFGYRTVGTLSIGDRVWKDANANGLQDSGETGVNGVTVQLLNSAGTVIATTTTSGDGNYSFGTLVAGTYTVKIVTTTLPANFTPTWDLDGISSANQATVNLTASRTDVDFGYHFYSSTPPGTGTLGYWKTHASAWPVTSITIGGVTYTQSQAITWLSTPVRGDESVALFQQLVPAELNALVSNNVSCITTIIQAADAWMKQYGPVGSGVSTSSTAGQAGVTLQTQLDSYNNGNLSCAQHRN